MARRFLAVPVLLLAACQPQQPPVTAAPAPPRGSIDLSAAGAQPKYDKAVVPVDETRSRKVEAGSAPPARPAVAASEREKQAIARWDKEEAALDNQAPPIGLRPPPRARADTLSLPSGVVDLPPPPEKRPPVRITPTSEAPRLVAPAAAQARQSAASPPPVTAPPPASVARPEPAVAAVAPPPTVAAEKPSPPVVVAPAVAAAPLPPAAAPVETAAAQAPVVSAPPAPAPVEAPRPPPAGAPAATITFAAGAVDLSAGDRILLERFARDANARRLRLIQLYGYSSNGDPVEARKIALARALAVHACLIDLGLQANIEVGDFLQAADDTPDRVDLRLR